MKEFMAKMWTVTLRSESSTFPSPPPRRVSSAHWWLGENFLATSLGWRMSWVALERILHIINSWMENSFYGMFFFNLKFFAFFSSSFIFLFYYFFPHPTLRRVSPRWGAKIRCCDVGMMGIFWSDGDDAAAFARLVQDKKRKNVWFLMIKIFN